MKDGIRVFQHVDDLTQIMWAKTEKELGSKGYNSVKMWAKEVRRILHMQCSDKNVIIPEGLPARVVQRALLEEGVKVSIENHGVDVGTDVTAGRRRDVRKLKERQNAGAKKAKRVSAFGIMGGRAKIMGITAVKPVHGYGASAVGADEDNIKSQKRNLAVATGKGLNKGTSS